MVEKQAPSKAEKTTQHRRKNRPAMKAHQKTAQPPKHIRKNHETTTEETTAEETIAEETTREKTTYPQKHNRKNHQSTFFQPSAATKTTNDKENG
jgi:hypothetical protein